MFERLKEDIATVKANDPAATSAFQIWYYFLIVVWLELQKN